MTSILEYQITALKQTSWACPSQWEATTDSGETLYVRYRWGTLTVQLATMFEGTIVDLGDCLFKDESGDEYDGLMETEEMLRRVALNPAHVPDEYAHSLPAREDSGE